MMVVFLVVVVIATVALVLWWLTRPSASVREVRGGVYTPYRFSGSSRSSSTHTRSSDSHAFLAVDSYDSSGGWDGGGGDCGGDDGGGGD